MPVLGRLMVLWCVLLVVAVVSALQLRFGRAWKGAPRWPDMTRGQRRRYGAISVGLGAGLLVALTVLIVVYYLSGVLVVAWAVGLVVMLGAIAAVAITMWQTRDEERGPGP